MTRSNRHVIVVGGGASGMMAALFALRAGASVTLFDHNEKLGRKLYITGKGRCNVTNASDRETFLRNVPRNPRFLHAALSCLSPDGLMALLAELGCPTIVERGRRVFPESQKASDVTRALSRAIAQADVRLGTGVAAVNVEDGSVAGVTLADGSSVTADAVILATGGVSYPVTGSTGDGHRMAEAMGHAVSPLQPSLVPLETVDQWPKTLQGLSLVNVMLTARHGKKKLLQEQGELLFTHFGASGPLILSLSSMAAGIQLNEVTATIDLKPAVSVEQLTQRLDDVLADNGRKQLITVLPQFMPLSLAQVFPAIAGVAPHAQCSQLNRQQRQAIIATMKAIPLHLSAPRPFDEAVITRGGVAVSQVDPSTMQSKVIRGLFFAGELLDVDALTGGYNLQIAFSTGALAGRSAARISTL